jgi:hypothetical protein
VEGVATTVGDGFTVTVNTCAVPVQPEAAVGVTVTKDIEATVPVLVAVNDEMSSVPANARPVLELLLYHAKVTPD